MTQQQEQIKSRGTGVPEPKPGRPPAFVVTAAGEEVALDESGQARAQFTVTNASGEALKGRLLAKPRKPAKPEWFSVAGESIRDFAPDATEQVVVQLGVPKGSRPGTYRFRLDAVSEADPDEVFTEGPFVAFKVAPPTEPKKRFPWWIPVAVGAAILLSVVGALAFLVLRDDEPNPAAVPAVISMSASAANSTLSSAGFTVTTRSEAVSDPDKNGHVQSQDPAAGTVPAPGSPVTITVGRMSLVPSVIGRIEATAKTMLSDADLRTTVRFVGKDIEVEDPPRDLKVLDQDPPAGTLQEPRTVETITLGPAVPVPDVRGRELAEAELILWYAGIVDIEHLPPNLPLPPAEPGLRARLGPWIVVGEGGNAIVKSQSPPPGTRLPHGSTVEIRATIDF